MPIGENAEDRARNAINAKDPKQGQEMQQVQALQSSIQEIQGERRNNLMAARMGAEGDARENQAMLQAAELGMLGAGAGAVAVDNATPVQQTSPQTQAILSKYGVGKPKNQSTTTRSVQQTPTKITINNNTTNNTTNNVSVPPSNQGPVQGRAVTIKQQPDQGQARFKTWINNAFARQNQAAVQREKEYQRREWSLSRTTGKLMKKLQELGTTISERMDPRKLTSTVGNQLKTLLFIFGARFLAKNWDKVLDRLAKLEYFFIGEPGKEGGERGRSGLAKMLIRVFGGDPNDSKASIGKSIKDFFYTGDLNKAGVFDLILEKIKHFFDIRGEAVKAIQPPKINLKDIGGTLTAMLGYVGDILKTLIAGPGAAVEAIRGEINTAAAKESLSNDIGSKGVSSRDTSRAAGATWGAGSLFAISNGKNVGRNYIEETDLTTDGKLRNTAEASIAQGRDIDRFINAAKDTGNISVTPVIQGLQRLKQAAQDNNNNKVPVDKNWVDNKLSEEKKEELIKSGDISRRIYKFVIRPKTEEEYKNQNFATSFAIDYGKDALLGDNKSFTKAAAGVITSTNTGSTGAKVLKTATEVGNVGTRWLAEKLGIGELGDAAVDAGKAAVSQMARWLEKDKIIDLVPADEYEKLPEGWEEAKFHTYLPSNGTVELTEISPRVLDEITRHLLKDENVTLDSTSTQQVEQFKSYLTDLAKSNNREIKYSNDYDEIQEKLKSVRELDKQEQKYKELEEQHLNTSNVKKAFDNTEEMVTDAVNSVFGDRSKNTSTTPTGIDKNSYNNIKYTPVGKNNQEFVDKMRSAYSKVLKEKGIDTMYTDGLVAQAALESAWGKSQSGKNNLGGITVSDKYLDKVPHTMRKTKEWENGRYVDKVRAFRDFNSLEDYANYHVSLLNSEFRNKYDAFNGNSLIDFVNNVVKGGYATDPDYAKKLVSVIKSVQGYKTNNIKDEEEQQIPEQGIPDTTTQPDASGTYITQNTTTPVWTKDGVEIGGQTYNPEVDDALAFNSWAGYGRNIVFNPSLNAMNMADNNIISPMIEPDNVNQVSTTKSSIPVGSSTIKTAGDIVTNNNTDNLLAGISDNLLKLNNSFSVIPKGQLAQIEAINILTQTMANIPVGSPTSGGEPRQESKAGFTATPSFGVG